ncbi:MAG: deoxyribodipyrimidine photo-lyase, partial [Gemmatimonadetes bacterium]|nr:deoxyribodipyrimidine photo-lyase [Gemmatimonadota bacterium]
DAKFIRKFCPELENVDPKKLHDVAKFTPLERAECDYPEPIVDHRKARERAIEAFKNLK